MKIGIIGGGLVTEAICAAIEHRGVDVIEVMQEQTEALKPRLEERVILINKRPEMPPIVDVAFENSPLEIGKCRFYAHSECKKSLKARKKSKAAKKTRKLNRSK